MGEGARPEPQERLVRAVARRVAGDEDAAVRALEEGWA
jgi:alanine-glyoxylate transaminase/serine-glyoxylate transaminase/serine-pyruvate transaminase